MAARRPSPSQLSRALQVLKVDATSANQKGWISTICPACSSDDSSPSLRVNVNDGAYKCYRCGAASDDVALHQFVDSPTSPSLSTAAQRRSRSDVPPLSEDLIARYHRFLSDSPDLMSDVERVRGWTMDTIRRLRIGWDGTHLWIPIMNNAGDLVNARLYDPFRRTNIKSFHYRNDEGLKRVVAWAPFGHDSINGAGKIWLFEGEPDAILAAQMGFPAVTMTGGAGSWDPDILELCSGRHAILCYDTDGAGRRGARTIAARLRHHGCKVTDIKLPLSDDGKDFTDAVTKEGRDVDWFEGLEEAARKGDAPPNTPPPVTVPLGGGVPGEPVVVRAHVLGMHTVPVLVPESCVARCAANWQPDRACARCPAGAADGGLNVEIDPESDEVLQLSVTKPEMHDRIFRKMAGIPMRCPIVRFDTGGMYQLQHMKLVPQMSERQGGDSTVRSCVHVSQADGRSVEVHANQLYDFIGKVVPDPVNNEWTLLCGDARPAEDDIDSFKLAPDIIDAFRELVSPPRWTVDSIDDRMRQEERSLARHVTKIYGRDLLLRAVDTVYHSVLKFRFRDNVDQRGWVSMGVFGDTRTGKSATMEAYSGHVGLGKFVRDPANTTYAGLIGGLQQVGRGDKSWTITWGLIPTNDRGLVIVDELSSLSVEDIGKMSGMRSSGVAEITKIRSAQTPARTRLIMSGNPRGLGKTLSSYGTPVEGFMDLIGAPEDVARFDIGMGVMGGLDKERADIDLGPQPDPIPMWVRRALVKFAWSRRMEHVSWDDGVEDHITKLAQEMVEMYNRHVPLVEPSEQDLRIARVAVALAVRTFSTTANDPNVVLVRMCHAEMAVRLMNAAYSGDLGYAQYSEYLRRHEMDKGYCEQQVINIGRNVAATARVMLNIRRVTPNSLGMTLGVDGAEARALMANLAQHGAATFNGVDGGRNTAMVWTPDFVQLLRDLEFLPPKVDEISMDDMF